MPKTKKINQKTKEKVPVRPPIVTVMGHVDHGKTSLLDAIRETNEAAKEFGGITQTIGASQITYQSKDGPHKITFIDTPGHEAFSAMRARGANLTDIVILVVAADDGVKPQTVEAIKHAKDAKVPIIVAINKIDLPGADPKKVARELLKEEIITEEMGGKVVAVKVSAKEKKGISELLEMITIVAEMLELKSNPQATLNGIVIESHIDSNRGPVVSAVIKEGTIKVGQSVVCDTVSGKVRSLLDDRGKSLESAGPSTPVEIVGFTKLPPLGAIIHEVAFLNRSNRDVEQIQSDKPTVKPGLTLESLMAPDTKKPGVSVILKADSQGSLEAVLHSLERLSKDQFELTVMHSGVGEVNKSDILLAKAAKAIVLSYRQKVPAAIERMASEERVLVRTYQIIYELIEEIEEALWGEVTDTIEEKILGKAQVINIFASTEGKTIAGCKVNSGRLAVGDSIKFYRNEAEIGTGKIKTLKHLKESVRDVKKGAECGFTIDPDFSFRKGDIIEVIRI